MAGNRSMVNMGSPAPYLSEADFARYKDQFDRSGMYAPANSGGPLTFEYGGSGSNASAYRNQLMQFAQAQARAAAEAQPAPAAIPVNGLIPAMAPQEQPQAIPELAKAPLTNYGAAMGMGASRPQGGDKFYTNALRDLWSDPSAFQKTPGFKAALDTGRQAIERSFAARGLGNSGNVLAELMKYGTGLASQEYGSQVDRLSRLSQYEQGNGDYWKNTRWGPRA